MSIPNVLKEENRWVLWTSEDETKVPKQASGFKASSRNPKHWTNFKRASLYSQDELYDGIGFMLGDGYVGVDFDHCYNPESETFKTPALEKIITEMNGYKEVSPSGDGIHVIMKLEDLENSECFNSIKEHYKPSPTGFKKNDLPGGIGIECYWEGRYFTMTGKELPCSKTLDSTNEEFWNSLEALSSEYGFKKESEKKEKKERVIQVTSLNDQEVLDRASSAKNGPDFDSLYAGSWEGGKYKSQSEADLSLIGALAFWTGNDSAQIERIFKTSGLYREDKGDPYLQRTIDKVVSKNTDVWAGYKRREIEKKLDKARTIFMNEVHPDGSILNKQQAALGREVLELLAAWNKKYDIIFVQGDLSLLENGRLVPINESKFKFLLGEAIDWMKYDNDGIPVPVDEVPKKALVCLEHPKRLSIFPEISGLVNHPIMRSDGTIVTKKGYEPETKLYILSDQELKSFKSVEEAKQCLVKPFEHFLFTNDSDEANAWAMFWTVLFDYGVPGRHPFFSVKAPQYGVGKTLLVKSLYQVVHGVEPALAMWPQGSLSKEETLNKIIGSNILSGKKFLYFDNMRAGTEVLSETLAAFATTGRLNYKPLYHENRDLEANMVIVFTGNNIIFGMDLARRTQVIELYTNDPYPEERDLPDIEKYIEENRSELLGAAMHILSEWHKEGRPQSKQKKGSFESWSQIIGGILSFAQMIGFETSTPEIDDEDSAFRLFIQEVWDNFGTEPWGVKDILHIALGDLEDEDSEGILSEYLSYAKNPKMSLGKKISQREKRTFIVTDNNEEVQVYLIKGKRKNPAQYTLV